MVPKATYEASKDYDVLTAGCGMCEIANEGPTCFPHNYHKGFLSTLKWATVIAKFTVSGVPLISSSTNV